ncbi:UNVERIFIED_CONTAM: hypothetical protein GTU68_055696, partial [Idotea baltica]|nr:hypothetical protein [Idotea baltica]
MLKISGEALMGDQGFGLNPPTVERIAKEVKIVHDLGVEICMVIGGGNIFRGLQGSAQGMERTTADYMGMLATVMNALAMQSALEAEGIHTRVISAITMNEVAEPYIRRRAVRHLETGRASASMLEPVMVDAYGSMTPINQVGTVNVPEPRMVTINVWDKALVGKVEKAIRESGLGINPQLNGTIIMLPIPELNEERRTQLTKVAGGYAENARVSIRNVRRDGMDQIKKAKNDGMSEDDQKIWEDEVQELTNKQI